MYDPSLKEGSVSPMSTTRGRSSLAGLAVPSIKPSTPRVPGKMKP